MIITLSTTVESHFHALPGIAYKKFNGPVVGKQHFYAKNHYKPNIITELQLNLQKYIKVYCCCGFKKISMKRKKLCCKLNLA